ncbi:MAG TPA: methyltransferase [Acidimicrobiales bacterium]|nr:methyltransferase [Acidimicrobiales bacterium]
MFRSVSPDHYFSPKPDVPSKPGEVQLSLPDFKASLAVDRGVFSSGGVDGGTMELLRAVPPPPDGGNLLDLGCGYGPIACTLAHRSPRATVWAVDINERALALTRQNAHSLGLSGVRAVTPDQLSPALVFDGIWSNPPIRIGKQPLQDLLSGWFQRLAAGASAWLVVQRHLGSDSLASWLTSTGYAVERTGSRKGYRILRVTRS